MDVKATAALTLHPQTDKAKTLRTAAEGFEELFLTQFLKAARQGTLGDDLMGSSAVDSTRAMFDAEIARASSGRTGFGIADAVERQFQHFVKG